MREGADLTIHLGLMYGVLRTHKTDVIVFTLMCSSFGFDIPDLSQILDPFHVIKLLMFKYMVIICKLIV